MSIKELLDQLRLLGVSLGINNGKLKLVDPQKKMTPELMQTLKQNKDAIVELMTKGKRFTQADFPLSKLDNSALNDLQKRYPGMEKVMVTTPMQQGLLFHSVMDNSAYISNTYCEFEGVLNLPLFKQAWQTMIDRHEIYRTCFTGFEEEHIHQLVLSRAHLQFEFQQWNELSRTEQAEAIENFHAQDMKSGFNLEAAPLFRLALFKLDEQKYHFSWTRHHVISDGWCSSIVFAEVIEIYQALLQSRSPRLQAPAPLDGYIDWLKRQDRDEALKYWRRQLSDVSHTTTFGIENYQSDDQEVEHRERYLTISGEMLHKLITQAKKQQTTMNVFVQAAWSYLLHLYNGEETVVIGSTISGRPPELSDVERMIGIFINTVPVVSRFSPQLSIEQLLSSLHQANLHTGDYGYLSLSDVQQCSDLSSGSLFNNIIVFDNYPVEEALTNGDTTASIGMRISNIGAHSQNNFDISLTAAFTDVLTLRLLYNCNRFSKEQVVDIQQRLVSILGKLCLSAPNESVSSLHRIEGDELKALISLGTGTENLSGRDTSIVNTINEMVISHSDNLAIDDGHCALTYQQLDFKVRRLAAFLQEQGIEKGERVGVYFERTTEMLLATLAILKTGASYVMLEPRNSEQRLLHIVGDAELELVLVQSSLMAKLPLKGIDVITIEEHMDDDWLEGYEQDFEASYIEMDSEAYVIYTSGSTGVPKGVSVSHQGLVDYCAFGAREYYNPSLQGSLVITSHGFDISIPSLFLPLMHGNTVQLLPWEDELSAAAEKLEVSQKQYLIRLTPLHVAALLDLLPEGFVSNLSHVFVIGGEQLTYELVARLHTHFPNATFYNHYGPSETVVGCSLFHITDVSGSGSIPIGRAMENTMLLVLDKAGQPVSQGMVGELHVAGMCVANGYVNLPELTAEQFIENPFGQGSYSRMYKTGDMVRFNAEGDLRYIGRTDDQVKVRGFRIELGDIVSSLLAEDEVENAVVIVKDQRLLAYVVTHAIAPEYIESEEALALSRVLKERLKTKLPEYMLPDTVTLLSEITLTANGKLDRSALPDVTDNKERVAPRNDVEMQLYEVWVEVLKHDQIGMFDSFFELGGHSILATRLISLIRKVFNCEIALKTLFEHPSIAQLAKVVNAQQDKRTNQLPALLPDAGNTAPRLSYAQRRLFFIDHLENGSAQFNMSGMLGIKGELEKSAFESTLKAIIERHHVLRTNFHAIEADVILNVSDDCTPDVSYRSLTDISADDQNQHVQDIAKEKSLIPFDLSRDKLFRVELLTLSNNNYVAIFNMHHISSDGWSMGIFVKEFCSLYKSLCSGEASGLPELGVQYSDFAHWQQSLLASEIAQQQMDYWKQQLQDLPVAHSLPLDNPRSAKQDFSGAVEIQKISADIVKKVDALCRKHDVTRFMFLETVFSLLLSRYGGSDDIVVGTPIAGRLHQNTEELIGCFINSLVLRTQIQNNESFTELLMRSKQMILDAFDNQVTPFDLLVDELNPSRNLSHDPIFQIVFSLNNTESHDFVLDDIEIRELQQPQTTSKSELEVSARELKSGELVIRWIYRDKLFKRVSINALMEAYQALIENILNDDTSSAVSLVSESKKAQLLNQGYGEFRPLSDFRHFAQMVEEQVQLSPDAEAIKFKEQSISYEALNTKANLLSDYLVESGIEPGDRIGIYLERSPEVILATLAINKAGASYVALEPEHPTSRIEYIIQDAGIELVLTRTLLLEKLKLNMVDVLMLDDSFTDDDWLIEFNAENSTRDDLPDKREMYVLYTSGTTGKPKGVEISDSGVANYLDYAKRHYLSQEIKASVVSSPLCFDATVTSLLTPLTTGLSVHILDSEQDVLEQLTEYFLNNESAYLFKITPSHLNAISAVIGDTGQSTEQSNSAHMVIVGGEQLDQKTLHTWRQSILPNTTFVNEYGPTETVVGCSTFFATPETEVSGENVSIGRAISNTQLYVLDKHQSILPALFQGELYIGGAGVAFGYANKPQLTNEKFVTNPYAPELSLKLYRTGDVVRWLADGTLEFLGRNDDQIKLNGYRIELAEIELQLLQHSDVEEAIVLKATQASEKLVAYIVHKNADACSNEIAQSATKSDRASKLQTHLRAELPNYMVPSQFIFIASIPLTTNGKVDVKALPLATEDNLNKEVFVAASNDMEKVLCVIWQELLSVDSIGIEDNYFALGGDSIVSIQIVSRARKQGLHFTVRDIFDNQTIRTLAQVVTTESQFEAQQDMVSGEMPLLPIQARFVRSNIPDQHHFNQSVLLSVVSDVSNASNISSEHIKPLVAAIYQRHDALRLRTKSDRKTGHFILMSKELLEDSVLIRSFTHLPEEQRDSALTDACESIQQGFDLETGSLLRVALFDLGNNRKRLFVVAHHLIIDAVSWRILLRDFESVYEQLVNNQNIVLDKKTSSIQQWADALKSFARSDEMQAEKSYWLEQLSKPYAVLKFDANVNSESGREILNAKLTESETTALISEVSHVYRTEVNEFLLAALAIAIKNWSYQSVVRVELEGHGREELFESLDVTETVGWFTSLYPLILDISSNSGTGEVIKTVKEQYRALPRHGIGYGLLKELQEDSEINALDNLSESQRIYFNYLGQFDSTLQKEGAFASATEDRGSSFSKKQSLQALANLTAAVSESQFHFSITFNPMYLPAEQANQFLTEYMQALRACLLHCSAADLAADIAVSSELVEISDENEENSEELLI